MTGRGKKVETNAKSKLPEVPTLVIDERNNKKYKKGEFLGKVSIFDHYGFNLQVVLFFDDEDEIKLNFSYVNQL